jgi:hypothetical protein
VEAVQVEAIALIENQGCGVARLAHYPGRQQLAPPGNWMRQRSRSQRQGLGLSQRPADMPATGCRADKGCGQKQLRVLPPLPAAIPPDLLLKKEAEMEINRSNVPQLAGLFQKGANHLKVRLPPLLSSHAEYPK